MMRIHLQTLLSRLSRLTGFSDRAASVKKTSKGDMEQPAQGAGVYIPGEGTVPGGAAAILNRAGVQAHVEENTPQNVQNALSQYRGVISSHDAGALWGDDRYAGMAHTVHTTGVVRGAGGSVTHYIINDTGTGEAGRMAPAQQYENSLLPGRRLTVTDRPIW